MYYNLCMKECWMLATTFDLDYVDTEDSNTKWSDIPEHLNCHKTVVRTSKFHTADTWKI